MKNKLSIIIAHYFPKESDYDNPLQKTIEEIEKQLLGNEVEIIIADDGSSYTNQIINDYTKKIEIKNDSRDIYMLEGEKLKVMLNSINLNSSIIKRWIYLPKFIKCMSKARALNYATQFTQNDNLLFLDDDNYFISDNSINNLLNLFNEYDFIIGQIKDNGGRNEEFAFGGIDDTLINARAIILADSMFSLDAACGILKDTARKNMPIVAQTGLNLNALGGFTGVNYNYTGAANDGYCFIDRVTVSKNIANRGDFENLNPNVFSAFVDFELHTHRMPRL